MKRMAMNPLLWAAAIVLLLAGYKLRPPGWSVVDAGAYCASMRVDADLDENRERLLAAYALGVGYDQHDPVLVSRLRDLDVGEEVPAQLMLEDRILRLRLLQLLDQAWLAEWQVPSASRMPADWQDRRSAVQRYEFRQRLEGNENALLPSQMPQASQADIARRFGGEFAATVTALPAARWVSGVVSPFGRHAVWVQPLARTAESVQTVRQRQLRWQRAQQRIWLQQRQRAIWSQCMAGGPQ